jgi:hypothetical protein
MGTLVAMQFFLTPLSVYSPITRIFRFLRQSAFELVTTHEANAESEKARPEFR